MKKRLLTFIAVCIGSLFFFLCASLYYYQKQDSIIFQTPPPLPKHFTYQCRYPFTEVFIHIEQKKFLNGLLFSHPSNEGVVMFFHGRGTDLSSCHNRAIDFLQRGYDVFMLDYRGFGKSSPGFKEKWLLEDGECAYQFLLQKYTEDQIIVYGHSLGTAIATWTAQKYQPKMLILEAPFYNILDISSNETPFLPKCLVKCLLKYHFSIDRWIQNVTSPIYIFHGMQDKVIPYTQSQKLYASIPDHHEIEAIFIHNAGHNNIRYHNLYKEKLSCLLRHAT